MATLSDPTGELVSDCSRCLGLCCVALPFGRSADFAFDKDAGEPCRHLAGPGQGDGCTIHARLRDEGMRGCTVYECLGAGQQVVQVTYGGRALAADPQVQAVFAVVRRLHELLVLLDEAQRRAEPAAADRAAELAAAVRAARTGPPEDVLAVDVDALRAATGDLLSEVSAVARAPAEPASAGADLSGRDLLGRDLRGHDVRRADLRGALLVAADLRGADLTLTDLLGADLRDADLSGANLTAVLFLTQPQVNAARGSAATLLPAGLTRPGHWA